MLSGSMPPVGTKRRPGNGAAMALSISMPPTASAGKNFTQSRPRRRARMRSLGVAQPGRLATPWREGAQHDVIIDARADDEPRPGLDGRVDLLGQQHRPGSHEHVRAGGSSGADGGHRGVRPEGELGDGQAARLAAHPARAGASAGSSMTTTGTMPSSEMRSTIETTGSSSLTQGACAPANAPSPRYAGAATPGGPVTRLSACRPGPEGPSGTPVDAD